MIQDLIRGTDWKEVYLNRKKNTISFTWVPGENVCIGETTGKLQDFLDWMKENWTARGVDLNGLPTIEG